MAVGASTFADLLRQHRLALGLTQADLADRAQLSERAISDLERGLKTPQRATVRLLGKALGLALTQFDEFEAARVHRRQVAPRERASGYNLPSPRTSFVGRKELLQGLLARLRSPSAPARLLTLTGPGGTGKTRLALEAASVLRSQHGDGVCYVELAPITDPRLVASTIAQALGIAEDARVPPRERLQRYLRNRQVMLILDNFEQVLGAAVDIGELLVVCPRLEVLVTSRAPLRIIGEQEFAVPPLVLPHPSECVVTQVGAYESVRLFVERARAVDVSFELTESNACAVAEICRRLEGLPLSIELAAARIRVLDPEAMLARLDHRLQLLSGGARDAPARQHTLRNTIAWSYDLLETNEQALLRKLSVCVGGIGLDAANAICAPASAPAENAHREVLDMLESLVANNLLRRVAHAPGEIRLAMLESIREFGLEQLAWSGELESVRRQHAGYYLELAEQADAGLRGPEARTWLDRLALEHDNLRAALAWSLAGSNPDMALRLAGALAPFWWLGGHFAEGCRWLARALAAMPDRSAQRMRALHGAGWLAHFQRESATARKLLEESLAIADILHDRWWQAWVLHALGRVCYFGSDAPGARQYGERSLAIAEALGDRWLIAWALHLLGLAAYIAHDYATADTLYRRCLEIRQSLGHSVGIVILLHVQGMLYQRSANFEAALARYREALRAVRELNSIWLLSTVLPHFAGLAAEHQPRRAARLGGAVTLMSESTQTLPIPQTEALLKEGMQLALDKLGQAEFAAAWAEGRAMSLEATIAEAFAVDLAPRREPPAGLTPAELEVIRRLARGYTSVQIAADLVIAVSTVDRHITHIYRKIGRRGRAAATAFALAHGLVQPGAVAVGENHGFP